MSKQKITVIAISAVALLTVVFMFFILSTGSIDNAPDIENLNSFDVSDELVTSPEPGISEIESDMGDLKTNEPAKAESSQENKVADVQIKNKEEVKSNNETAQNVTAETEVTEVIVETKKDDTDTDIQKLYCTLSISCNTILDNISKFNKSKLEILPENGIIYSEKKIEFTEGETVFDILLRETKKCGIHFEFVRTPIYNSNYVEGIHNIYELDCGELSGWIYKVNNEFPSYSSSKYTIKNGDRVEWVYTCDLGRDVGGGSGGVNQR